MSHDPPTAGSNSIDHLHRHPEHISLVAGWIHGAFWTHSGRGVETVIDLLREAVDPERIPLSLLALVGNTPAGTVQLIACDSKARPDLTPWLAALFVDPRHRDRGIGASLVRRLLMEAARLRFTELFLETDIPEFYARLGATRYQPLADGGWIMRIAVSVEMGESAESEQWREEKGDHGGPRGKDIQVRGLPLQQP